MVCKFFFAGEYFFRSKISESFWESRVEGCEMAQKICSFEKTPQNKTEKLQKGTFVSAKIRTPKPAFPPVQNRENVMVSPQIVGKM